jgi:hypothetical protein
MGDLLGPGDPGAPEPSVNPVDGSALWGIGTNWAVRRVCH